MASFVCVQLENNVCMSWAQTFSLPPLSLSEGAELGFSVLLVYAAAWGANLLCRQIVNWW